MANKIRLGFIGANVRSTWASQSHFPALQGEPGRRNDCGLHHARRRARKRRARPSARSSRSPISGNDRLEGDRRRGSRGARAAALRADEGRDRSRQARLHRVAARPHHGRSGRAGGARPAKRRADRGRPAIAREPRPALHEGADRSGLRRRGACLSRRLHARRRAGAPVQPHLAARREPRCESADHRQRARHRCACASSWATSRASPAWSRPRRSNGTRPTPRRWWT